MSAQYQFWEAKRTKRFVDKLTGCAQPLGLLLPFGLSSRRLIPSIAITAVRAAVEACYVGVGLKELRAGKSRVSAPTDAPTEGTWIALLNPKGLVRTAELWPWYGQHEGRRLDGHR